MNRLFIYYLLLLGVDRKGWGIFSMFARMSPAPTEKDDQNSADAILGEPNSFYYDEKEGRWVNKNVSYDC